VAKVSIIMTTYNRLGYLKDCLKSFKENTNYDHELIVVDDFSDDGTREYLENYEGIDKLILSKTRSGVSSSRNRGILQSTGDIVGLIDDDNLFIEGWLQKIVEILDNFPEIGGVTAYRPLWEIIDDKELLSPLDSHIVKKNNVEAMIIKYLGGALFMKRSAWDKVGPFSHTDPRSGIGRYSDRIRGKKYLLARTRYPVMESMDIGHHPMCRKFTEFKNYTDNISPEEMREMKFFDDAKNKIIEFNNTHKINEDGKVVEK